MRSRPALAVLFLLCAARAQAFGCSVQSFSPEAVKGHCRSAPDCRSYQTRVLNACASLRRQSKAVIERLMDKKDRTPDEERELRLHVDRGRALNRELAEMLSIASADDYAEKYGNEPAFTGLQKGRWTSLRRQVAEIMMKDILPSVPFWRDDSVDRDAAPTDDTPDALETPVGSAPDQAVIADPDPAFKEVITAVLETPDGSAQIERAGADRLAAGRPDEAVILGKALVEQAPADHRGPSLLAQAALSRKRPDEAARWAEKALELNPNDKNAKDALHFARSELSARRLKKPVIGGFQESRTRDLEQGRAAGALPPRPGGPAGAPPSAEAKAAEAKAADPVPRALAGLLRRGYEKMNLGDLTGALGDVSVHLDAQPGDDQARLLRAEILLKLGKPGPALADIDAALAKRPDDPRALRARAAALYELGRDGEALTAIERALALEPASGIGRLTRAKILERLGRVDEALAEYRAAARLDGTLEPIVDAALRRLGAAPGVQPKAVERGLLRGGLLVVSVSLVLLGLVGGAVVVTRRGRKPQPAAAGRTLQAGDLVAGQYRVTRELGRGGMGVVFEAVDEKLKRAVALKQLQGEFRASVDDAARFLQEARLVAQLRHPNVAEIYAAVEDDGLYLVFELVRGRSLDALLGAGVTPEQARGIVAHACAALTAAHARRIVHRDLKPSNLMISDSGEVKVMDFGIAHQSMNGGAFTQTSASGTPPYMAPEQAMGSVSSSSDLYAMGVMTYELLTGVRPFPGPDFLGPKMRGEYAPVTSRGAALPARLDAFFASALSPDPARRPADAAAFAAAFAACWS